MRHMWISFLPGTRATPNTSFPAAAFPRRLRQVDDQPTALENRSTVDPEVVSMAWNVKGEYVETCSCELMCPCNLSLDHGATYDFCRVTLVFDIREGDVDGTDVGGLKVALIADT